MSTETKVLSFDRADDVAPHLRYHVEALVLGVSVDGYGETPEGAVRALEYWAREYLDACKISITVTLEGDGCRVSFSLPNWLIEEKGAA